MAERASAGTVDHEKPKVSGREKWLNGWYRRDDIVVVRGCWQCAGCGQTYGMGSLVIATLPEFYPEYWVEPDKDPDWPFEEARCPVHINYGLPPVAPPPVDRLTLRLLALKNRSLK